MKFTVPTTELRSALAPVARAAASRGATPILAGALITVSGTTVTLCGTDTNIAVTSTVSASDTEDGVVLVPATLLAQLTSSAAGDTVTISFTDGTASAEFKSGKAKSKIHVLDATGFPTMDIPQGQSVILALDELVEAIESVRYALSSDDRRGVLHGMCIDTSSETPVLVATDSLRMATCELPTWSAPSTAEPVIVPGNALAELVRRSSSDKVTITFNQDLIGFELGDLCVVSRLIAGNYPKWRPLFEGERSRVVTLDAAETISALKRIEPMTKGSNHVEVTISGNAATISATGADGSMVDSIAVSSEGDDFTFRVNPKYLQDALAAIATSSVELCHNGDPARPLELRRPASTVARSLVMPIRTA